MSKNQTATPNTAPVSRNSSIVSDFSVEQAELPADGQFAVKSITRFELGAFSKARVSITAGPLLIHDLRVMEKDNERWVSLPARPSREGSWFRLISFIDNAAREKAEKLVLAAHDLLLAKGCDKLINPVAESSAV